MKPKTLSCCWSPGAPGRLTVFRLRKPADPLKRSDNPPTILSVELSHSVEALHGDAVDAIYYRGFNKNGSFRCRYNLCVHQGVYFVFLSIDGMLYFTYNMSTLLYVTTSYTKPIQCYKYTSNRFLNPS